VVITRVGAFGGSASSVIELTTYSMAKKHGKMPQAKA